jgi:hypothetical protein
MLIVYERTIAIRFTITFTLRFNITPSFQHANLHSQPQKPHS